MAEPAPTELVPTLRRSTATRQQSAQQLQLATYYNVRINPSNTGNIRGQSRFTLCDSLILTVDPSYQYVLANGGGSTTLAENSRRAKGANPASAGSRL